MIWNVDMQQLAMCDLSDRVRENRGRCIKCGQGLENVVLLGIGISILIVGLVILAHISVHDEGNAEGASLL